MDESRRKFLRIGIKSAAMVAAAEPLLGWPVTQGILCAKNGAQAIAAETVEPTSPSSPDWLRSGTVRFARFDGGPAEAQKVARSSWGSVFSSQDREVLTNLYGKYGDRMVELLAQAKVNFVWVTYSVGFSWQDEAEQRVEAREILQKLHARGIKVAAYMCATTIFWESMFKDVPQSVKWIKIDSNGIPYRYDDGLDAMRFIADLDNAEWVEYQERRVAGIIDDGFDAIVFDNSVWPSHSPDISSRFLDRLRNYARQEKKSSIAFFANFGLFTPFTILNQQMDLVFDEGWVEPGAWGDEWNVSNIRRDRWVRGINPPRKAFITECSIFHKGDRSDSFLGARSQKLVIAEAAAFGSSYTWDMEGPFDTALVTQNSRALESWAAICQYNGFLADHASLYAGAVNVAPWVVLLPDGFDPGWNWGDSARRIDFLIKSNVLCDLKLADRVTKKDLTAYQGVIAPAYASLSAEQKEMVRDYQAGGGKIYIFAGKSDATSLDAEILPSSQESFSNSKAAQSQVLAEITSLASAATRVAVDTPNHVLANVTFEETGETLIVHLLNYDQTPVAGLKLELILGKDFEKFAGRKPILLSPDTTGLKFQKLRWRGSILEVVLPSIDSYSLLVLQ